MTALAPDLVLRPRPWIRGFLVVFPIAFAASYLLVVRPEGPVWVDALIVFVFAPLLAWRLFRLAAVGTADGRLVVRNQWRDRTVHRDDVDRVVIGRSRNRGGSVHLELADGSTLELDVTEVPFRPLFGARLERSAASLEDWSSGRPQPFPGLT